MHVEPTNYAKAARDPTWVEAMKIEIDSIEKNQTWNLTVLPQDKKKIRVKWVFRTKFNPDGLVFK